MNLTSTEVTLILTPYSYMDYMAKSVLFIVVFLVYFASIIANITIMSLIYLDTTLHKPMFLFLFSLIVNGLIGSTAVWPNVMILLLTDDNKTSIEGCLIQAFLMITYGACNFSVLTVMAYDRFLSIFKPLQYHLIMTPQKVTQLLFVAHFFPAISILVQICLSSQIALCKYTVRRIFCDNLSFYSLSCQDSFQDQVSNLYGLCIFIVFGVLPLILIVLSYLKIITLVLKASRTARGKALETCAPHLIIFINFSLASFFSVIYNRTSLHLPIEVNIIQSINYNLIPPLLHPLIYGIKNQEIKRSIAKIKRNTINFLSESQSRPPQKSVPLSINLCVTDSFTEDMVVGEPVPDKKLFLFELFKKKASSNDTKKKLNASELLHFLITFYSGGMVLGNLLCVNSEKSSEFYICEFL